MGKQKIILLTFDVEEFDLPTEYNITINEELQMIIGKRGVDEMEKIINAHKINTTLFTTANFANHFVETIKNLSIHNEIASHAYYHSTFCEADLLQSKLRLEQITGNKIVGLRMPRFKKIPLQWIKNAGYEYDSSINPTFIPGRYNNLAVSRTVYEEDDFTRVPVSVTPNIRFPLFWMAFKNLPYSVYKKMALSTLKKDGYLSLYFHPWEFTDISEWKIPFYLKKHSSNKLSDMLQQLIIDLKNEAEFTTIKNFLKKN